MASISLCMITKNEERHLQRCLDSLKNLVCEMIIVDTGSTDRTKEIAKEYTDNVFDLEWMDDFSEARNFSLQKASKEWVIVLDADEFIEKGDVKDLLSLIENTPAHGLCLIVRNYTNDSSIENWIPHAAFGFSGYFPSKLVRVFRNDPRIRFQGKVHELVRPSIEKLNKQIEFIDIPIHHLPSTSLSSIQKKREYYRELLEEKVAQETSPLAYLELGIASKELGMFEKALQAFENALRLQRNFIPAYLERGQVLKQQKRYEEASRSYATALGYNQNSAAAYFGMGICQFRLGRYKQAEILVKRSLSISSNNPSALASLGAILEKQGKLEEAQKTLEKSIELNPNNSQSHLNLAIVLEKRGKAEESRKAFQKAIELNHPKSELIKEKIKNT